MAALAPTNGSFPHALQLENDALRRQLRRAHEDMERVLQQLQRESKGGCGTAEGGVMVVVMRVVATHGTSNASSGGVSCWRLDWWELCGTGSCQSAQRFTFSFEHRRRSAGFCTMPLLRFWRGKKDPLAAMNMGIRRKKRFIQAC
ncbi:hypothetical protein TcBrA4_0072200 [Trypanosoma cruzi]|nr:hypothetical protein TcBrA4_0072200 [Trypanosoma cruzi]